MLDSLLERRYIRAHSESCSVLLGKQRSELFSTPKIPEIMRRASPSLTKAPTARGTSKPAEKQTDSVAAVMKVFGILQGLGEGGLVGITELSQRLLMSKSTVHRLLQTMREMGYVRQEDGEKYALTIKLFELGSKALPNLDLVRIADSHMRIVASDTRETVHLGGRGQDCIVYLHTISSAYNLRMQCIVGSTNPLYSTAIGKVLLAFSPEEDARVALSRIEFKRRTKNTLVTVDAVMKVLPKIRTQGFSEDIEEQEEGLRCFAVPVMDHTGNAIAAMSTSFPLTRFGRDTRTRYVTLLNTAARSVSEQLGFREYPEVKL